MVEMDFKNVTTLIAEPDERFRKALRGLLLNIGFSNILETGTIGGIEDAFIDGDVDFIIINTGVPDGPPSNLIEKIRNGESGENPFIVILVLVADPTPDMIRSVISSGADDVLAKPFLADQVCERVLNLSSKERSFIVTSDYIGPDRRPAKRPAKCPAKRPGSLGSPGSSAPIYVSVPNPIAIRAEALISAGELKRRIHDTASTINQIKMECCARLVGSLTKNVVEHVRGDDSLSIGDDLRKIRSVATLMNRRLLSTQYAAVAEICAALVSSSTSILNGKNQDLGPGMKRLEDLAKQIQSALLGASVCRAFVSRLYPID